MGKAAIYPLSLVLGAGIGILILRSGFPADPSGTPASRRIPLNPATGAAAMKSQPRGLPGCLRLIRFPRCLRLTPGGQGSSRNFGRRRFMERNHRRRPRSGPLRKAGGP